MGYTTSFEGSVKINPPLNLEEVAFLRKFATTRRMNCVQGPYYVERGGLFGQKEGPDVLNYNEPPEGQPGLWCKWAPSNDGASIRWNNREKFYNPVEWMTYLIDHFIGAKPAAKAHDPAVFAFLQGHICNGQIDASGEAHGDLWRLFVTDNIVTRQEGFITYR